MKHTKSTDPLSKDVLGFSIYIPYDRMNMAFTEVKTRYRKKGSVWIPVESKLRTISAEEYSNGCSEETVRFFNRLGSARRSFGYTEYGYTCTTFSSISPDGTEKSESRYYPVSRSGAAEFEYRKIVAEIRKRK